ncbi:MAG: recombinase RecT [Anaerovoracaceae bacterium]
MAKANGGNTALLDQVKEQTTKVTTGQPRPSTVKGFLASVDVRKRFEDILGKKAPGFISSIINVTNGNDKLIKADPLTIISAAAIAASLDLPIDPNLGFAYIIPYGGKAQFQMGYRGYIQLAMRTGQYKTINACEVYEGELQAINRFTGEIELGEKISDVVIGYLAYFKLLNGFEKYLYMSKKEVEDHAKLYSKSFFIQSGRWQSDFDKMAIKTVLKLLLSKYGILSIDMKMETALKSDQAVVKEDEEGNQTFEYEDNIFETSAEVFEEEAENENEESKDLVDIEEAKTEQDGLFDEKSVGF